MPPPNQQDVAEENPDLDNFQRLVLMMEMVNKLRRQMNASRQARHADTTHTTTVSDNEEEEPVLGTAFWDTNICAAGEVLVPCPEGMRREIHGSVQ